MLCYSFYDNTLLTVSTTISCGYLHYMVAAVGWLLFDCSPLNSSILIIQIAGNTRNAALNSIGQHQDSLQKTSFNKSAQLYCMGEDAESVLTSTGI